MRIVLRITLTIFITALLSLNAFAKLDENGNLDPEFGPEFTFTRPEILAEGANYPPTTRYIPSNDKALKEWSVAIQDLCRTSKTCSIKDTGLEESHVVRVTFKSGWWYEVSLDPYNVEIRASKGTLSEWQKRMPLVKTHLFGVAEQLGLKANKTVQGGAGHINMGADVFEGDVSLYASYLADYANHPELATLFFPHYEDGRKDFNNNAVPLQQLPMDAQVRYAEIIRDAHAGKYKSIQELSTAINEEVYIHHPFPPDGSDKLYKYHALNDSTVWKRALA